MEALKKTRKRGVVLTVVGLHKLNAARRQAELIENDGDRLTLENLCERTKLSLKTITKILDAKIAVDRYSLEAFFNAFELALDSADYTHPHSTEITTIAVAVKDVVRERTASSLPPSDWGEAPAVDNFYGRRGEIDQLHGWIQQDCCRLITVLGMGGIGKTALVTKLAHELASYRPIVWRSLRNAPSLDTLLVGLLSILSQQQETKPDRLRLLHYLQQERYIIVLDNLETLLCPTQAGVWQANYENYGEFFRLLGETEHQSCLILTSREKILELVPMEGENLPVRSFTLQGSAEVVQGLFCDRGLSGTTVEQQTLGDRYGNSPLAIQIISTTIRDLFDGQIGLFLEQDALLFRGIRRLLSEQFNRLSDLEQAIMTWLAINRDGTSLEMLLEDLLPASSRQQVLEALEGLQWRSLIERQYKNPSQKRLKTYTQQPVIMEYVTEHLTEQVSRELLNADGDFAAASSYTHRFAILKTTLKDYIRESQSRLILEPICQQLQSVLGSPRAIANHLKARLAQLQTAATEYPGEFSAVEGEAEQNMELTYGPGNILNLLCHLKADLTGLNLSGLAIWHAYLPAVPLARTNFSHTNLRHTVFNNYFSAVFAIAASPDGQRFATGEIDGTIRVWDLISGQLLWSQKGHQSWIWSVAFCPNNSLIAVGSGDPVISLWDQDRGVLVRSLVGHQDQINEVAFNSVGDRLASASSDGTIRLWDVITGESFHCLGVLSDEPNNLLDGQVWTVAFSPNGEWLASGSSDHHVHIWSVQTGEHLFTLRGHQDHVYAVAFHPHQPLLASGSADKTIILWSLPDGQPLHTLQGHNLDVLSLSFSPDGNFLASSSSDETIRLWQTQTGQVVRTLQGHLNWIRSIAFHPDGVSLLSGSSDYSVRLWDLVTGQTIRTWQGYSNWVWSAEFSADGKTLLSGSGDRTICLWDATTGQLQRTFRGHNTWVLSVAFNCTGTLMASAGGKDIHLWDIQTGRIIQTLSGHSSQIVSLQISPVNDQLVSGSSDYTARLWNLQSGQTRHILQGHTDWVRTVAFNPDGHLIATASHDTTARLWDAQTGLCLHRFIDFTAWVWSVDFHPREPYLAIASENTAYLFDLNTYQCLHSFSGHTSWIRTLRFSPDGQLLATGSQDGQIRLWSMANLTTIQSMTDHQNRILSVRFSPDGQTLVSTSAYETLKIWHVVTGKCLHTLKADGLCEGMNITGISGLSTGAISTLKQLGAFET